MGAPKRKTQIHSLALANARKVPAAFARQLPNPVILCYPRRVTCNSATRRWLGALCLLIAIAMLVADEYFFRGRLRGVAALAYWFGCFGFTVLAICAAFLDVRALRRTTRDEQRALFENTLENISQDKQPETGDSPGNCGPKG